MKEIAKFIKEGLKITSKTKVDKYNYHPETKGELQDLINQLIEGRGNEGAFNDIDVSKINNINNVVFETTKSVYSVDDVISKRIRDEISDEEYDKITESFKPSCQMKNLADNNVVLYRPEYL